MAEVLSGRNARNDRSQPSVHRQGGGGEFLEIEVRLAERLAVLAGLLPVELHAQGVPGSARREGAGLVPASSQGLTARNK